MTSRSTTARKATGRKKAAPKKLQKIVIQDSLIPDPPRVELPDLVAQVSDECRDRGLVVERGPRGSTAILDRDGRCRYVLTRRTRHEQHEHRPPVVFVGLNPSTADATADDNTIKRCMGFAERWSAGGIIMVNLFAFRATHPQVMKAEPEPVGGWNNWLLSTVAHHHGGPTTGWIAAWGEDGRHRNRARTVREILDGHGIQLRCLGVSKQNGRTHGEPYHPLYQPYDAVLRPLPPQQHPDMTTALINIACRRCGLTDTATYPVADDDNDATRFGYARARLETSGWSCTIAGDYCPDCVPADGGEPAGEPDPEER